MRSMLVLISYLLTSHTVATECDSLNQINWLLGEWQAETENSRVVENWRAVSPDTFEGQASVYPKQSDKPSHTEYLRLTKMGEAVYYLAKVPENPLPVAFKLVRCTDGRARLENRAHDFPNHIDYRLVAPGHFNVSVTDLSGNGFELNYRRPQLKSD